MAWTAISGIPPQFSTDDNDLAVDYWLKLYDSGTTTPYSMATDSTGGTRLAKCKVSAEGYFLTNPLDDTTVFIPHVDQDYRIVLYRNETDADNNTTANAAFNVDGIVQEVAQLAAIEDITTKGTTLQAQDDYDRSPLFVDGTDFTAGAGPHVITVPADWNPTNADMRFYRLDSSGIVTDLTPTSTTSTTFTLAETLLSTDTIYIGDDVFRNQMDGDPEDIRTRLDVLSSTEISTDYYNKTETYTQTEVDDGFQAIVAEVANHVRAGDTQIIDGSAGSGGSVLTIDTVTPQDTFETFGPTGSGATNIWATMDDIPSGASVLLVTLELSATSNGSSFCEVEFFATAGSESSTTVRADNRLGNAIFDPDASGETFRTVYSIMIPLDSSQVFRATWTSTNASAQAVEMYYRGFMAD